MLTISEIFDEEFYLAHNSDVADALASGELSSALEHYVQFGQFEGRLPRSLFSDIYVFGDSFSDTGNLFNLTEGRLPDFPNFQGRFSNGPIWVETLAPQLALEFNPAHGFAVGGASTGTMNILNVTNPNDPNSTNPVFENSQVLPGIQTEIDAFIADTPAADPQALYVVWGGSNDYVGFGSTDVQTTVGNLEMAITRLTEVGARNFMVPNLFDLGVLPLARQSASEVQERLTTVTQEHNTALQATVQTLEDELNINIISVDVYSLFNDVIARPAEFGFTNVTDDYLTSGATNAEQFLFWNIIHPTTRGHDFIAETALRATTEIPEVLSIVEASRSVPEPNTSLFAYGLVVVCAIAFFRKRKLWHRSNQDELLASKKLSSINVK